jgi:hypothetical protein
VHVCEVEVVVELGVSANVVIGIKLALKSTTAVVINILCLARDFIGINYP